MENEVVLTTKDGVKLYGSYFQTGNPKDPAVVLLHMMPADRKSWYEFQKKLKDAGFQSLAIDLRGHGKSLKKNDQEIDYKSFTDKEQQEKIFDVEASVDFFESKGILKQDISLVGASIGANLALWYQSENPEIKASVLLSPGLDYRGVTTEDKIKKLSDDQFVLFASGGDKDSYSRETVKKLFEIKEAKKDLQIFEDAEHGTNIFKSHPEFEEYIINKLKEIYK